LGEPAALPVGAHAEAEAVRVDLLTHESVLVLLRAGLREARGLGVLLGVEPDLGLGDLVVPAVGGVVEHRVGVALDGVAVGTVADLVGQHRTRPYPRSEIVGFRVGTGVRFASAAPSVRLVAGASLGGLCVSDVLVGLDQVGFRGLGVLHAREALDVFGADDVLSGLGVQLVRHGRLGRGFGAGLGAPTAALDARPATGGGVGAGTLGAG